MAATVLFDRYRLVAPAGTGGSAQVWHAIDERTGDHVAVKRLHPLVFADDAGRQRLRREFLALRTLSEPHVVRVRDLHIGEDEAALILDDVDGPSLAALLAERRAAGEERLSAADALAIVDDVAAALAAAHAAGIVHRDVTPPNILLSSDGEARLTDFGIAHASSDQTAVTATGQLVGTLHYLAPEQLRGEPATPASDVHALAAVAYEMLAGRPAYDAATPVALAEAHTLGPPPIDDLPPALEAALRRGLAADPAARPASVSELAAELRTAAGDDPSSSVTMAFPIPEAAPAEAPAGPAHHAVPAGPGRPRSIPAPVAALLAIVAAIALLAAASGGDRSPFGTATGRSSSAPGQATSRPTPTRSPTPNVGGGGEGHGHGGGNGNGHGHGG